MRMKTFWTIQSSFWASTSKLSVLKFLPNFSAETLLKSGIKSVIKMEVTTEFMLVVKQENFSCLCSAIYWFRFCCKRFCTVKYRWSNMWTKTNGKMKYNLHVYGHFSDFFGPLYKKYVSWRVTMICRWLLSTGVCWFDCYYIVLY